MKHILIVVWGGVHVGGVQKLLLDLLSRMDRRELDVDLYGFGTVESEEMLRGFSGLGVRALLGGQDAFRALYVASDLRRIMNEKRYDVVHCNTGGLELTAITMLAAWMHRVPVRIAHAHGAKSFDRPYIRRERLYQWINRCCSVKRLACSRAAAEHLFGKSGANSAVLIQNGIDTEKFRFDAAVRGQVRRIYGLEDALVVGHVGRFDRLKNHAFLLDVFAEVLRREQSARLLLVGDGALLSACREKAARLGVDAKVIFAGTSDRVWELYQAMDVFAFPSVSEGLGIAAIEAQACGLPVVCADAVPPEAQVTAAFEQLSLRDPPARWSEAVLAAAKANTDRSDCSEQVRAAGYDISSSAERLCRIYHGARK